MFFPSPCLSFRVGTSLASSKERVPASPNSGKAMRFMLARMSPAAAKALMQNTSWSGKRKQRSSQSLLTMSTPLPFL
jgi:hypothetical protein